MANIKPNVSIPLAASYNQRGTAGFTNAITNGTDQKKVNTMYEIAKNAVTGNVTLDLTLRPGISINANTYGSSGQVGYLVTLKASPSGLGGTNGWVISVSGNDKRVSDTAGTTVIDSTAGYVPRFIDHTAINGTDTVVLQLMNDTFVQKVFYSTTRATWTEITDSDWTTLASSPGFVGKMEFMDGYAFIMDSKGYIYNSNINSLSTWDTGTDKVAKQIEQDVNSGGLARLGKQIIAFGLGTMEVFVNNGNPSGSPLSTIKDLSQRYGMRNTLTTDMAHYYANVLGRIYWVGRSAGGGASLGVFSWNGSTVEKVSNSYIDEIVSSATMTYSVGSFGFNGRSAVAIRLDAVTATTQRWLMFFPEHNEWFQWESTVFMPVNSGSFFMGVGDNQHRLYSFGATDNWQDDGTSYSWIHQFKLPKRDGTRHIMTMAGVIGDTSTSSNDISISWSDDDCQTFSTARTISLNKIDKSIGRLGSFVDRTIKLYGTNTKEVRLQKFIARIE